jgi:hypothetical protein
VTEPNRERNTGMKLCRTASITAGLVVVLLSVAISGCGSTSHTPARSITARLVLRPDRVEPGATTDGRLVLKNPGPKTAVLLRGCRINGLYGIGMRSPDVTIQAPAFSLVSCLRHQTLVAKPGTTVYRFKLAATYTGCTQSLGDELPKTSPYWTPLCGKGPNGKRGTMPPLPPGTYTAVFVPNGKWKGPTVRDASLVVEHHTK